ncbi:HAMP domain-containing sensor histidine kinase [Streptacidiphilus sp. N1-10]|uniref:histidine kinase n=1 Tax=Streptacidiphilus jeojiensis TaxID=3229225 RepID=A0ABV6XFZ4_9ACTN
MTSRLRRVLARSRPRSIRARSALAAGLAAAVLFTVGALWMRTQLVDTQMASVRFQAEDELGALSQAIGRGDTLGGGWGPFPYQVIADDGSLYTTGSSDLDVFEPGDGTFFPAPRRGSVPDTDPPTTIHFGTPPGSAGSPLAGRTFPVLSTDVPGRQAADASPQSVYRDLPADAVIRIFVVVTPFQAQDTAAAADRVLIPAVPLGVLLVAAVAYLATRRALRPVEAIRARTAAVSANDPRERVEVPDTGDEIAALAVTINSTLQRLDEAAGTQRRFIADAAHELRSPLTVLLADLDVALAYPDRADWPAATAGAARQARRLQALTEDLLLLARLDAGAPPTPTDFDLADLAASLVRGYTSAARAGAPRLTCSAAGPVPVLADPRQMERLLRNLLDNALRYAASRVEVTVRPGQEPGQAVLEVADDGPGIAAADRDRVFDRFTRLADARDRDSGGTGLGLAIARDLAHSQHGRLELAPGDGPGARFVLYLDRPVAFDQITVAQDQAEAADRP